MNTSVWPPMLKHTYNVRTQLKSFSFQALEISNMYLIAGGLQHWHGDAF